MTLLAIMATPPFLIAALVLFPRMHLHLLMNRDSSELKTELPWLGFEGDFKNSRFYIRIIIFRIQIGRKKGSETIVSAEESPLKFPPAVAGEEVAKGSPGDTKPEYRDPKPRVDSPQTGRPEIHEPAIEPRHEPPRRKFKRKYGLLSLRRYLKRKREAKAEPSTLSKFKHVWYERDLVKIILKALMNIFIKILKAGRIDFLKLKLRLATGDPMLTGVFFGVIQSINWINVPRTEIAVTPDFESSFMDADFSGSISIRLIHIMFITSIEMFKMPWIRIYRTGKKLRAVFAEN